MKASTKDITREIRNTIHKFISILLIVALGVFVLVGLISTGPIMRNSLEEKIDELNYADMIITCPSGFENEDMSIIEDQKDINELEYGYDKDMFIKGEAVVIKLLNYPYEISMPEVVEGRDLKNKDEIILDLEMKKNHPIGSTISFDKDDDENDKNDLDRYDFKVVGYVNSLDYIQTDDRGYSERGYGKISGFGYILPENFSGKPTIAKLNFDGLKDYKTSDKEYGEIMKQKENALKIDMKYRPIDRLSAMKAEISGEIEEGEDKIDDAETKLADAKDELVKGREDLNKGREDYNEGLDKYYSEKSKGEKEIANSRDKLYKAKRDIDKGEVELADGDKKLKDGKSKLLESKKEIDDGEKKLTEGKEEYQRGLGEAEAGEKALAQGEDQLRAGRRKLDDGWDKIESSKRKLDDGVREYRDGKQKYLDGLRQIEDGKRRISSEMNMSYEDAKDAIGGASFAVRKAEEILKNAPTLGENKDKLLEDKRNLESQIERLDEDIVSLEAKPDKTPDDDALLSDLKSKRQVANKKLDGVNLGLKAIDDTKKALDEINSKLPDGFKIAVIEDIERVKAKINEAEAGINKIENSEKELAAANAKLDSSKEMLRQAEDQLNEGIREAEEGEREYAQNKRELEDNKRELEDAKRKLANAKDEINSSERKLEDGKREYEKGQREYEENYDKFMDSKAKLERGKGEYELGVNELQKGEDRLDEELGKARGTLDDAKNKLYKGEKDLAKGESEYKDKSEEAKEEIEKAREDIKDGRRYLSLIKAPRYTITSRHLMGDINVYIDYSERVDGLSLIFPVFFFAITLLVSFTTITRMVEDERTIIGTYKALGYPNKEIAKKFFIYGMLASLIGGVLGSISGSYVLPYIIGNAYSTKTIFEQNLLIRMFPLKMVFAIMVGFVFTAFAAALAVNKTVKEKTAALLRPKPPAKGNRILLEKIPFIWNHMSFLSKVTARNLFRSKKRMLMTIMGVLGCAALLVLGFGIADVIKDVETLQFDNIIKYNVQVLYDSELFPDDYDKYREEIDKEHYDYTRVYDEIFTTDFKETDQEINVLVPDNLNNFNNYFAAKDTSTGEVLDLSKRGAVVSEKLAKIKKLKVGDTLRIKDVYGNEFDVEISGICELYLGHFMVMNKDYYETVTGSRFVPNTDLFKFNKNFDIEKFAQEHIKNKSVMNVTDMHDARVHLNQFLYSIKQVELVILVVSTILELVVLYNLTNINIEERIREVSTIKVLGFQPKEATIYIYKETYILAAIGIAIGLGVGKLLHLTVIRIVVPYMAMLPEHLTFRPFLYSAIITAIINVAMMFIFHFKIKKINPLDALSSVE